MKDLWYRVRREPNFVENPKSKEKQTVWVDFYWKKSWIQTSAATSAMLTMLEFQKNVALGQFLGSDS